MNESKVLNRTAGAIYLFPKEKLQGSSGTPSFMYCYNRQPK